MKILFRFFFTVLLSLNSTSAFAASGSFTPSGASIAWPGPSLSYHPEAGTCGHFSNSQILTELQTYIGLWDASDFINLTLNQVSGTVPSVDSSNYSDFSEGSAAEDSTHPVIFDDDGEIIESTAGAGSSASVLGFAGPSSYNTQTGEIVDGEMVMNCRCLEGNPLGACTGNFTFNDLSLFSTLTHEFGHLLGLDHSQVNIAAVNNDDDGDNNIVPLMYPTDFTMTDVATTTDDIVSLAAVYPTSNFLQNKCKVTGALLDSSGNPLRCADVQAVSDDLADTVSFVSGAAAVASDENNDGDTVDSGECSSGCGNFTLYLTPGTTYSLRTEPIDSSFTGGSSVGPCSNEQLTTINSAAISTIAGSDCVAGQTLALGNLTTSSTGGNAESGGSDDSGSSSSGAASSCSLAKTETSGFNADSATVLFLTLGLLLAAARFNAKRSAQ